MFKQFIVPILIAMAGTAAVVTLVIAKPKPAPTPDQGEPPLVKVAVTKALPQSTQITVTTQGTVLPKRQIDVVAQVTGLIVEVDNRFHSGGFFAADQHLVKIDDREYQAKLLVAKSHLADAKRKLAEEEGMSRQAKREWRDLGNDAANDLFVRKPQLAAAKAAVAAAEGEVLQAELNLERTNIALPFDGRVQTTLANLGQFVTTGTPIARVYDANVVEVRLPLTESEAALVALPLTSSATHNQTKVTLKGTVAGNPAEWHGVIKRTDAFVNESSRMLYAVVEVAEPFSGEVPLLPGLFVEADIEGKNLDHVLVLPKEALYKRSKLLTVNEDNIVEQHQVKVLHKSEEQIWVQADIEANTFISLEKQAFTPEGTEVEPVANSETAQIVKGS